MNIERRKMIEFPKPISITGDMSNYRVDRSDNLIIAVGYSFFNLIK